MTFLSTKSRFAKLFIFYGELAGIRTQDPRLKRALLYQLSYELSHPAWFPFSVPTFPRPTKLATAASQPRFHRAAGIKTSQPPSAPKTLRRSKSSVPFTNPGSQRGQTSSIDFPARIVVAAH